MEEWKVSIFSENEDFVKSLKVLNSERVEDCVEEFISLSVQVCTKEDKKMVGKSSRRDILRHILDRVAFYPLNPNVMKEELKRLGLNRQLSEELAGAWALKAKKVVAAKKALKGDLDHVQFEILRDISADDESVDIQLQLTDNRKVFLNFSPDQLYGFYEQLEVIQSNIDIICK